LTPSLPLTVAVLGQKGPQILFRDPNNTPNPVRRQEPSVDPTSNGPGRYLQEFGDLPDGEEFRDGSCLTRARTSAVT
jgi:hypothetical protein